MFAFCTYRLLFPSRAPPRNRRTWVRTLKTPSSLRLSPPPGLHSSPLFSSLLSPPLSSPLLSPLRSSCPSLPSFCSVRRQGPRLATLVGPPPPSMSSCFLSSAFFSPPPSKSSICTLRANLCLSLSRSLFFPPSRAPPVQPSLPPHTFPPPPPRDNNNARGGRPRPR